MNGCLGNIQWRLGSNGSCFLLQLVFLNASCLHFYILPSRRLSHFSLSQSTSFEPSPFLALRAWDRVQLDVQFFFECPIFPSTPARASVVVHGPACLCWFISFPIQFYIRFSIKCDGDLFVELAAGLDLASFRKNVIHSSPRPRCLGSSYKL